MEIITIIGKKVFSLNELSPSPIQSWSRSLHAFVKVVKATYVIIMWKVFVIIDFSSFSSCVMTWLIIDVIKT